VEADNDAFLALPSEARLKQPVMESKKSAAHAFLALPSEARLKRQVVARPIDHDVRSSLFRARPD